MSLDRGYWSQFWRSFECLIENSPLVLDRPKGSAHPRFPDLIYPIDYGYLGGTISGDGDGMDIWLGTEQPASLNGLVLSLDLDKKDAEMKLVMGCSKDEIENILSFLNSDTMHAVYVTKRE